jgi:putative membrane protein
MTTEELGANLALLNAILNGTSASLIFIGRSAIREKNKVLHKRMMLGAFATSSLFLVSYLTRVWLTGTHKDPHTGLFHVAYLAVLVSHMTLAMAVVPLVLLALAHGLKDRIPKHKKIVKYTYPIWLYVSVTGVLVYVMLYRL